MGLKVVVMVAMVAIVGFGYGKVWWPLAAGNPTIPESMGILGLYVLGDVSLIGMRRFPALCYELCMFAGFEAAAIL